MNISLLLPEYLFWHYTLAIKRIINIFINFLWFFYHFFSVPVLFQTLFSPWHKLNQRYKPGLDLGAIAETIVVNTIVRTVGFIIRSLVLLFSAFFFIITLLIGILFLLIWLLLPIILVILIFEAIKFFVS